MIVASSDCRFERVYIEVRFKGQVIQDAKESFGSHRHRQIYYATGGAPGDVVEDIGCVCFLGGARLFPLLPSVSSSDATLALGTAGWFVTSIGVALLCKPSTVCGAYVFPLLTRVLILESA